ncbi:DUF262 domain-containing protein [uncultured Brevundimonas sp.]|uniref:DUF262 domain-containing protein n=1 Tax=uncultured Brevundimonas sp. TaxID=213418 RepID=UPI0025FE6681|nr:DUF262 domain-containing protein [uncultured Brevundimonas sp.]
MNDSQNDAVVDAKLAARQQEVEDQIRSNAKIVDYKIREYPIEVLVEKYLTGQKDGANEVFIPDYQRDFVWPDSHQSRFIESVLIGLPIPYMFVADIGSDDEELSGRLEVVDGTQRLRTLTAFEQNELKLEGLKKLTALNGLYLRDLLPSRQRRFRRITIRLIELTEHADEETRRDMFDRINSGAIRLNPMETRRGVLRGPAIDLFGELANDERLHRLAPLGEAARKRRDYDELVARFFAYADNYENFDRSVIEFIDEYIARLQSPDGPPRSFQDMRDEWEHVLHFVDAGFAHGFAKNPKNTKTPRVRFEAIAVGTALALRVDPSLKPDPEQIGRWAYSKEFQELVSSDGANSRPRVKARIEYVRDHLLGQL